MYYLGIDVGGTFTDVAIMNDNGGIKISKVESTPQDPSAAVINGIKDVALSLGKSDEEFLSELSYIAHGTTVATNAMLERKGAKVGLITTKGFEDTMFIQRCQGLVSGLREDEIRHFSERYLPDPIVPKTLVRGITERIDYKGSVVVPLEEDEARRAVKDLVRQGVEAIAVSFLWSFKNPEHEQHLSKIISQEAPGIMISLSSYVCPVIREYERTATTVLNAYLSPSVTKYVNRLKKKLDENGLKGFVSVLNSSGGVLLPEEAGKRGVSLIGSGPSGGVLASQFLGGLLGHKNIITTDMGGTSFDASIIADGSPTLANNVSISKYLIHAPAIDVTVIGSGGGSIARVEEGKLKVGPESAGSDPGPVCYGQGGKEPTVTDADVVLGMIDPDYFLAGKKTLNKELAEQAIREKIAEPLGMEVTRAASAIRRVVNIQMAELIRTLVFSKGFDPRDFVVYGYGGAGPTHCASYGSELGVRSIIVPLAAPALSATGLVSADLVHVIEKSDRLQTPIGFEAASDFIDADYVTQSFEALEEQLRNILKSEGVEEQDMSFNRSAYFRYRRQINELSVPVQTGKLVPHHIDSWVDDFETMYEKLYGKGTGFREAGIEIVTFRVEGSGRIPKPVWRKYDRAVGDASKAIIDEKDVFFWNTSNTPTKVYDGAMLGYGHALDGPAIIRQTDTTVVVGPTQKAYVDEYHNVVIS
ncbi:hydantoinase/oxoprolinase [delta proteobacterium NaphS2]|nr:hydantoinase/oxoprolinase [delta proteobacterium NaphS2]